MKGAGAFKTPVYRMQKDITDKEYADELARRFAVSKGELNGRELLELLLSFTDCKHNVRDTADAIGKHFGSFRNCYFASSEELTAIDGVSENAAILMLMCASIANRRDIGLLKGKPVRDFCSLFLSVVGRSLDEELWAAALTESGVLINVECISKGSSGSVDAPITVFSRFAAKNNSRHIVIAHSHFEGAGTEASKNDIRSMEYIGGMLSVCGIALIGQVIVSGNGAEFYPYTEKSDDI